MAGEDARLATGAEARDIARMLHDWSVERSRPTPRAEVLAERLAALLDGDDAFAVVAGAPPQGVALVTLRPNVWSGTIAVLDVLHAAPGERREGIGTAILALVVDEAARRGASELEAEVGEADVDAQRFAEGHDMPLVDARTGDRALVVRRTLR